jgi:hypothetical protein
LTLFPKTWPQVGVYYIWGLFIFSILAASYGAMYLLYLFWLGEGSEVGGVEEQVGRRS